MALGILWATLLGAGLGLDRSLRDLRVGVGACALWSAIGALVAVNLRLDGLSDNRWAWPLAAAASATALGHYLATTTAIGGSSRPGEPWGAIAAAFGFGLAAGFGSGGFLGLMGLATIFALAWRPLVADPAEIATPPARTSGDGLRRIGNVVEIGRRPQERGHDDESREQREEQRQGEQLAHAGGAGMAGQA